MTYTKKELIDYLAESLNKCDEIFISQIGEKILSDKITPLNEHTFKLEKRVQDEIKHTQLKKDFDYLTSGIISLEKKVFLTTSLTCSLTKSFKHNEKEVKTYLNNFFNTDVK